MHLDSGYKGSGLFLGGSQGAFEMMTILLQALAAATSPSLLVLCLAIGYALRRGRISEGWRALPTLVGCFACATAVSILLTLLRPAGPSSFDPQKPVDPEFRPWEEIQGTDYERYASRFVGAQDSEDVAWMKAQIDRSLSDCYVLLTSANLFKIEDHSAYHASVGKESDVPIAFEVRGFPIFVACSIQSGVAKTVAAFIICATIAFAPFSKRRRPATGHD